MNDDSLAVSVVIGIIKNSLGRVLINQRLDDQSFAGKWEFPGGKVNTSESLQQALFRELLEETGIRVIKSLPLISYTHQYSDRLVKLHVFEVLTYEGEPEGREHQPIEWVNIETLHRFDFLEANASIVRAVQLPRYCLITQTDRFGVDHTLERLKQHVASKRCLVLVREKPMSSSDLKKFLELVVSICAPSNSMVINHADNQYVDTQSIDGVHYSSKISPNKPILMDKSRFFGKSCHDLQGLQRTEQLQLDYAFLSPVKLTSSHAEAEPLGWSSFSKFCAHMKIPVFALGGLSLQDLEHAASNGAQGVSVLSDAWR